MYKKKKRKSKKDFSSLIQQLSLAAAVGGPDRDWHGKQKNGGNGGGGMNIIAQKKNLGVLYINSALKMSALTQVKGIDQKSKVPNVVKSNGVCCLLRRCLISRPEWEKNFMIWYHLMIVCRPLPRSPNGPEFLPTCYDVKRGIDLVIWPATDVVSYLFGRKEWEREKSSEIFYLYVCIFSSSRSTTSSWLRVGHTAKKSKQRTGKFIVSSRSPLSLSFSLDIEDSFFFPPIPIDRFCKVREWAGLDHFPTSSFRIQMNPSRTIVAISVWRGTFTAPSGPFLKQWTLLTLTTSTKFIKYQLEW